MFSKKIVIILLLGFLWSCNDSSPTSTIEDNEIPQVSIYNPLTNTFWDDGVILVIKVQATDNEKVVKVEVYIDGLLKSTKDSSEYGYNWNTKGEAGSHHLLAKAYDATGNMGQSATIDVKIVNEIPIASFSVSPTNGDTSTVYKVDASASSDKENTGSELQVRWDWESDGIWDTDYGIIKTAEHQYTTDGIRRILLEVKDNDEQVDTTSLQVSVYSADPGTVTDIDGNVYNTVKIGDQWWMVENLRVTHYRDGSDIPFVYSNNSWVFQKAGAYCYYDMDTVNIGKYGLLYNFHAVDMDNYRGLAPQGWHVASNDEWKELEGYLGMSQEEVDKTLWRGTDEGGKLKEAGSSHWKYPNTGATNESGFTALPGGWRSSYNGTFEGVKENATFWTSTGTSGSNNTYAKVRGFRYNEARISYVGLERISGCYVRCVKD